MANATAADRASITQRMKALSDEKRLRILEHLADGERCVCDLTDALDAGPSLLSFHLKTLKDAGLSVTAAQGAGCTTPSMPRRWPSWRRSSGVSGNWLLRRLAAVMPSHV